ncbi:MAG: DUF3820 family protein [Flavobacteriaceae bacterium]
MDLAPNAEFLKKLLKTKMPYGKYKGLYLVDLPEPYIVWYHSKGFPSGQLGKMLSTVYEIKLNGLEDMISELRTRI